MKLPLVSHPGSLHYDGILRLFTSRCSWVGEADKPTALEGVSTTPAPGSDVSRFEVAYTSILAGAVTTGAVAKGMTPLTASDFIG
jgi:hypothetical protein